LAGFQLTLEDERDSSLPIECEYKALIKLRIFALSR